MSIQSSINQMLSSVANQQLFKGLTTRVGEIKTDTANFAANQPLFEGLAARVHEIKTDTANITAEQKSLNELVEKYGSARAVKDAADYGKQMIEEELEAREKAPGFDDAVTGMSNMLQRIKNTAQTRVKMRQILAEDTQDTVKERYEQSKGGAQK